MSEGGASVVIRDPRLTAAINWVWATLGAVAIIVGIWGVKSINELNSTMTRVVTQNESIVRVLDDHGSRIRSLEQERRNER